MFHVATIIAGAKKSFLEPFEAARGNVTNFGAYLTHWARATSAAGGANLS
jgi:hypothetical protein